MLAAVALWVVVAVSGDDACSWESTPGLTAGELLKTIGQLLSPSVSAQPCAIALMLDAGAAVGRLTSDSRRADGSAGE
jgi:hypothetical protein